MKKTILNSIITFYCFLLCVINASEYFVATYGSDNNVGSFEYPFRSIQRASEAMSEGDICYIRQGTYHENISITNQNGSNGQEIVFTNYNNEKVVLDGTTILTTNWQIYSGNIWKTSLDYDIWQLFLDRDQMMMARWPNANFEDGSIWDKQNHWGHGTIDQDEMAYENGTLIDEPHGEIDLANSGLNIVDAIAILNVGSYKTWTRRVLTHSGNTFTYDPVPEWKTKHHDYYLEGKLEFLDTEGEWFFDPETRDLFFFPPNGTDPNELLIRGKTQSYAFEIIDSDHVTIRNLEFFGTTFRFHNSDYGLVEGCNLYFPSCYKKMLGVIDTPPDISIFTSSSYGKVYKSAFRYTDGSALEMYSGNNTIEDCYFYHIDHTATDLNGLMTTIQMGGNNNIFRRNTMHKMGASATLNPGNEGLIEFNDMSDSGYMQSDGSLIQCMVGQQPGVEIRYNWLHDTIKYGARFDGNGAGNNGLMHHNVIWNVQGGIMVKGYEHNLFNNTAFDNGDKNDIIVMIDQGGNEGSITRNNAANKIAGHRSGTYQDYPVPGIYDHNWNGYETGSEIKDQLVDPENYDFRPHPDSDLIDAGTTIESITDNFIGDAPDQGAYEYGGEMWIPGITWDLEDTFGNDFIFPESFYNGPVWHVSNFGSNNNSGDDQNPFETIQYAYNRASENDTILVHPGVFNGSVWLYEKNVTLISLFALNGDSSIIDSTVIDGQNEDCNVSLAGGIDSTTRISGFTIQNGVGCVYGQGGGIYTENSSPKLDNLIIKNNTGGTLGGGMCLNGNSDAYLENIIIENNSSEGGGGIYIYNSNPTIISCTIRNNYAYSGGGAYLTSSNPDMDSITMHNNEATQSGGAIFCGNGSNPSFRHFTIVNNSAEIGGAIYSESNSLPNFSSSILWNNFPQSIYAHEDSLFAIFSNIDDGWIGEGNINTDPLFCDADSIDYSLAENSPCIGTGEYGSNMGSMNTGCTSVIIPPSNFSLLIPEDNYQLNIDESNQDQSTNFIWSQAIDSSDSLFYKFIIGNEEGFSDSIDTDETSIELTHDYFINLFSDSLNMSNALFWDVMVSDLDTSLLSSNGPFALMVNISDLLLDKRLLPDEYKVFQNYPNPFNPITNIQYQLPKESYVNINIYNLKGKKIRGLLNKKQSGGYYTIIWDAKNNFGKHVSAGVYLYEVKISDYRQIKKMILLK